VRKKIGLLGVLLILTLVVVLEKGAGVAQDFEPRPENFSANHIVLTQKQLQRFYAQAFQHGEGGRPGKLFTKVDGQFTGSTDQIRVWGARKWGFDPDLVRAIAMTESPWRQHHGADCTLKRDYWPASDDEVRPMCGGDGRGHKCSTGECASSYGILQIKAHDFPGTWPLSLTSTAFNVDFKLAAQRSCMGKQIAYIFQDPPWTEAPGHPSYAVANGDELL
jgi:hypothetical protein